MPSCAAAAWSIDLLDLLQLHEVVRGTDGAETQPCQLPGQSGHLLQEPGTPAPPVQVKATALLDPLELLSLHAITIDGELAALDRSVPDLAVGEVHAPPGGVGVALADRPVEGPDGLFGGAVAIEGDQGHATVHTTSW